MSEPDSRQDCACRKLGIFPRDVRVSRRIPKGVFAGEEVRGFREPQRSLQLMSGSGSAFRVDVNSASGKEEAKWVFHFFDVGRVLTDDSWQ